MEKYDFIKLMLKSRNLSVNDKKRLVLLATQEIEKKENNTIKDGSSSLERVNVIEKEHPHAPKDTAAFLSLFNHDDGFKFLTHNFDPDSEMEYDELLKIAREKFFSVTSKDNNNGLIIPSSLYALMRTILLGGDKNTWMDSNGKKQTENFACKKWTQWAEENPQIHVLTNESINKVLMAFRSTIRLVLSGNSDSRLETIIKRQAQKHANLSFDFEGLNNNSDFYTYANYLEKGIKRILDDLSKYSKDAPKVKISYESSLNGDYRSCVIIITQYGSFSTKSLEDVQNKFNDGGGDFHSIKNILSGYCNWSVETKWGGQVKRWNILDDSGKEQNEDIDSPDIPGFTHTLTYYSKLK